MGTFIWYYILLYKEFLDWSESLKVINSVYLVISHYSLKYMSFVCAWASKLKLKRKKRTSKCKETLNLWIWRICVFCVGMTSIYHYCTQTLAKSHVLFNALLVERKCREIILSVYSFHSFIRFTLFLSSHSFDIIFIFLLCISLVLAGFYSWYSLFCCFFILSCILFCFSNVCMTVRGRLNLLFWKTLTALTLALSEQSEFECVLKLFDE